MPKLSVIILSYALDDEVYQMNTRCLDSLFASEQWRDGELEVLLMESNKEAAYQYDPRVRVLMPEEKFGFHRFFNIVDIGFLEFHSFVFCRLRHNHDFFELGFCVVYKIIVPGNFFIVSTNLLTQILGGV